MANIFPSPERLVVILFIDNNYASDQETQNNVSIRLNSFFVVLEVTVHDRGSVIDGLQWKTEISPSSERLISIVFMDDNYAPDQDAQIHMSIIVYYFGVTI